MPVLTTQLGREPGWRLALAFMGLARDSLVRRASHVLNLRTRVADDALSFKIPDSAICRAATEHVAALSPPFLLHHGIRSFVFGAALGCRDARQFDPELLYLACIMHDLGLTEAYCDQPLDFELVGAQAAYAFLMDRDFAQMRAAQVHEAIALHARIGAATRAGSEAALTHLGAGMDVIGVRAEDFRPEQVATVLAAWPRLNLKSCFAQSITAQARIKPHSNIAGHVAIGFCGRIAAAPFNE